MERHALHLLGLEGERPVVRAGEHPPEAAVALVLVVEIELRLDDRAADAQLLRRLALRAFLVRLAGRHDPARREVVAARIEVLDRGAALHEHPSPAVEDEDVGRPVGKVPAAHAVSRQLGDGTVVAVHHGDDLFTGRVGHRGSLA